MDNGLCVWLLEWAYVSGSVLGVDACESVGWCECVWMWVCEYSVGEGELVLGCM